MCVIAIGGCGMARAGDGVGWPGSAEGRRDRDRDRGGSGSSRGTGGEGRARQVCVVEDGWCGQKVRIFAVRPFGRLRRGLLRPVLLDAFLILLLIVVAAVVFACASSMTQTE